MKCPYCREEIADGAKKCKVCDEFLGFGGRLKRMTGPVTSIIAAVVSIVSLTFGYIQLRGKNQAVQERDVAEERQEAAVTERDSVATAARTTAVAAEQALAQLDHVTLTRIARATFQEDSSATALMSSDPGRARAEFVRRLEADPSDVKARTGLLLLDAR